MRRPARTTLPVRVTAASFGLCENVCMDSVNGCFRVELFASRDDCVCGSGQIDIVSQGLQAHIAAGTHVTSRRFHALVVEKNPLREAR